MKIPVFLHDLFGRIDTRAVPAVLCVLAVLASGTPSRTSAQARHFSHAGGVALWTKGDSVTRFDRIAITPLPAVERR
jgi:hypothetical protein